MRYFSKIPRFVVYVILGLLLISIAVSLFSDSVIKHFAEEKVAKAANGQYSLQLKDLNISLLENKIRFEGILLKTNSSKPEDAPFIDAEATALTVTGISIFNYFFDDQIILGQILLEELNLKLQLRGGEKEPEKPFRPESLDIYPAIQEFADLIRIEELDIRNSNLSIESHSKEDSLYFSTKGLNINNKDFLLAEGKLFTGSRTFYSGSLNIKVEQSQFSAYGADKWQAKTENIHLQTDKELSGLSLNSLSILQNSNDAADSLFFLSLELFGLQGLNLNKLQEEELAVIGKVKVLQLHIFYPEPANPPETDKAERDQEEQDNLYEFTLGNHLPAFVNEIKLDELEVRDFSLQQGNALSIEEAYLLAEDIAINEKAAFAENRFLHSGVVESGTEQITFRAGEPVHQLLLSGLYLHTEEGIGSFLVQRIEGKSLEQKGSGNSIDFVADQLNFSGFDTRQFATGSLVAESLKVNIPWLRLHLNQEAEKEAFEKQEKNDFLSPGLRDIYPGYDKFFRDLRLGKVEINNSGFSALISNAGKQQKFSFQQLGLKTQDVLIGENSMFTASRSFFSQETDLEIKNAKATEGDEWQAEAGSFNFRTREDMGFASIRSLNFLQQAELSDTLQYLKVKEADLGAFSFNRFQQEGIASLENAGFRNIVFIDNSTDPEEEGPAKVEKEVPEPSLSELNLKKYLPAYIKGVEIGELGVNKAVLRQGSSFSAENASLTARDIRIGQQEAWADNRFLHAAAFKSHFSGLEVKIGEPGHRVKLGEIILTAERGTGSINLQNLLVSPEKNDRNTAWAEAEMKEFRLERFNTSRLSSRTLILDSLLSGPVKMVYHLPESDSGNTSREEISSVPDLYPLIEGQLDSLKINYINFPQADIRLSGAGGSFYGLHLPEAQLELKDILIAKGNAYLQGRVLHASDIRLNAASGIFLFPDRVYSLLLDQPGLSTKDKTFKTESLRFGFSENFDKILEGPEGNELYRLISGRLLAEEIQWDKLFRDSELVMGTFSAENPDVYVFKDFNKPEPDVIKPMPYDLVHSLDFPVYIDKVQVNDMELTYEEMAEGADKAGLVNLTDMDVTIRNFTNMKSRLVQEPDMKVIASGKLMGKGDFESTITVPLLKAGLPPRIRGSLDTLDITELNRIARYNSRIAIETGTLYEVKWDFEAGEDISYGDFEVSYENLTIQLSESDSPDTTGFIKKVGSFLANSLIVDSNIAEEKSEEPKKVKFEQERDKKRSFFNFYVKSLLGGLIEAVGVPFN